MVELNKTFEFLDNEIQSFISDNNQFNQNVLFEPITITESIYKNRFSNFNTIQLFFAKVLTLFKTAIEIPSDFNKDILKLLMNDSSDKISLSFYKSLDEKIWTLPKFYRTDESKESKVFEIQCPGSGWGEVILLEKLYKVKFGNRYPYYNIQNSFIEEIKKITGKDKPWVMHLLDNSSNPSSMRYFIRETSKGLKYWGFDKNVINSNCDFVRSHSVYGLIAENLFKVRLEKAINCEVYFDLPPLLIFDQKMILCLPFLDETRHLFNDNIRQTLAYTYTFTPKGFRDFDGSWISIEEFRKRIPSKRKYFLKYGGCDTSVNWGSRAVYRLDSNSCDEHINMALKDFKNNRPWIIQKDCSNKEIVSYIERNNNVIQSKKLTAKYSAFYGPNGLMAIRTHHRQSTKVHGQKDSVVGLAYSKT
ncbi:MAG: hypothetical protein NTZ33_02355 [Bacteroidetes bacterium]|nr:hypothetical protein [Bacteroidota bacterium]